ncbi:hypothetical protein GEMRC1_013437 [Eukaryota sp. GEM-RC1]
MSSSINSLSTEASFFFTSLTCSLHHWVFKDLEDSWGVADDKQMLDRGQLDLGTIEKRKEHKTRVEKAMSLFNEKPVKAYQFLIDEGFFDLEGVNVSGDQNGDEFPYAPQFARWIMNNSVDKTSLGMFLGNSHPLSKATVPEYFKLFEFKNQDFVSAFRTWLVMFELPKEAQEIDRVVESFAQAFASSKEGESIDADSVYALAFATLMLNTDMYNPKVLHKMPLDQFILNFRGVAPEDSVISDEFLQEVYRSIAEKEIQRHQSGLAVPKRESDQLQSTEVILPSPADLSFVLVELVAGQLVEILSNAFLLFPITNKMCLTSIDAIEKMIELLCKFSQPSLCCQLSMFLLQSSDLISRNIISLKNVAAVEALLRSLKVSANFLTTEWILVLTLISELQRLLDFPSSKQSFSKKTDVRLVKLAHNDYTNSKMLKQRFSAVQIDSVFSNSQFMDDRTVVSFLESLCIVADLEQMGYISFIHRNSIVDVLKLTRWSREELNQLPIKLHEFELLPGRFFSLQKIVEVTYLNTDRVRHVFTHLWKILSNFLLFVASSSVQSQSQQALIGINSLRQLALKFLERDENPAFKFQKEFLKPFESIISISCPDEIVDVTISVLAELVSKRYLTLKSGWKTIFKCFSIAFKRNTKVILQTCLDQLNSIVSMQSVFKSVCTCFSDVVSTLTIAINCDLTLEQIEIVLYLLSKFVVVLANNDLPEQQENCCSERFVLWNLFSEGLTSSLASKAKSVDQRKLLMKALSELIFNNFEKMTVTSRESIMKTSITMLTSSLSSLHSEAVQSQSVDSDFVIKELETIFILVKALCHDSWESCKGVLSSILEVFKSPICDGNQLVAHLTFTYLKTIIFDFLSDCDPDELSVICAHVCYLVQNTLPSVLIDKPLDSSSNCWSVSIVERCREVSNIHMLILDLILGLIRLEHFYTAPWDSIAKVLEIVKKSSRFAKTFNQNIDRRIHLTKSGLFKHFGFPSLMNQEIINYKILFHLQARLLEMKSQSIVQIHDFVHFILFVIQRKNINANLDTIENPMDASEFHKQLIVDAESMIPLQAELLYGLAGLDHDILEPVFVSLYLPVANMMTVKHPKKLRNALAHFFVEIVPKFVSVKLENPNVEKNVVEDQKSL